MNTIAGQALTDWNTLGYVSFFMVIIGILLIGASSNAEYVGGVLFGIALLVIGLVMFFTLPVDKPNGQFTPTKYEVKITDPNYVIDASKYKIIEKRDKIIELEEIKVKN